MYIQGCRYMKWIAWKSSHRNRMKNFINAQQQYMQLAISRVNDDVIMRSWLYVNGYNIIYSITRNFK